MNTGLLDVGTDGSERSRSKLVAPLPTRSVEWRYSLGIGSVVVANEGSDWSNSSLLVVGHVGHGLLTIEAVGTVSNTTGSVGDAAGAEGTVIVRAPAPTGPMLAHWKWASQALVRGTIENGGEVVNFTDGGIGVAPMVLYWHGKHQWSRFEMGCRQLRPRR